MDVNSEEMANQKSVKVVRLEPSQWEIYRDIRLRGLQDDPQAFARSYGEELEYPKEKWVERVSSDYNMVALEDGKALGTMSAYETEEDDTKVAHIVGVYVPKEARGKGVGSKLLAAVLRKIKEDKDIKKVDLTVNKEQIPAVRLYEKFGFQIIGEETQKMGDGKEYVEHKMELTL